jgi:hypothetical protein
MKVLKGQEVEFVMNRALTLQQVIDHRITQKEAGAELSIMGVLPAINI